MSAPRLPNDEMLTNMTTAQLRQLLEKKVITHDEHSALKCKRRRLQNRIYARTCAKKKQTEIARLAKDISEEEAEIELLKNQLSRVNISVDRIHKQIRSVKNASRYLCNDPHKSISEESGNFSVEPRSIKVLDNKGRQIGCAYLSPDFRERLSVPPMKCSMETNKSFYENDKKLGWKHAPSNQISQNNNFVRPVGGGYDSSCRGISYS